MLKSLGTELKVGIFAVVALVTLGYMLFVLTPEAFESKEYVPYYTILSNASGIVPKTHVKTAGVSVGKVKSVTLEGGQTKIKIEVDKAVGIPIGSKVEVRSVGLLGDKHLEIIRPKDEGRMIEGGGFVPQSSEGADMESLMSMAGEIAKDVKKITNSLANVLGTKKGEQSVQNIVDNIEQITSDVRASTATLRKVIGEREGDWQDVATNVRDGIRDFRVLAGNLRNVASQQNIQRIDRILASFDATMVDVRGSAKNINLISEKVEKGEGTLGKLVNDESTLTEIQGAIKDLRKVLAPATKLQIDFQYQGEFRRDKSTQHYGNIIFRTRPDRYYLLGVTDTSYDVQDQTYVTDNSTPGTTKVHQTIRERKALRFNAQVAKRWYNAVARFGFFESTGGLAGDLYFFSDRLRLTAEAFDWDLRDKTVRRNVHLKTYASVLFYNHVSALIGLDDPSRTDPDTYKARKLYESWFVGAGLSFTDDDLKAVFGSAALLAR